MLFTASQVCHRRRRVAAWQFHLPHDLPRCLVVRTEHLPAPARWKVNGGVAALSKEDERLGNERADASSLSERGEIQRLQRGMVTRPLSVRDRPHDVAFVE